MLQAIERVIRVEFRHQVFFTRDVFNPTNLLLRRVMSDSPGSRIQRGLVVVDEALIASRPELPRSIQQYFESQSGALQLVCPPVPVEGGERAKNSYFYVSEIQSRVDRYHLDGHSYIVAVGGGALLDVVGLAAATAHRGLRHIRIPTTTLSQADSGVGVKNGINAFGKKNFIGTFAPPFAVINDFDFLHTLSERDKRSGYIEAVKVALIRDAAFFEAIERDADALAAFDPRAMEHLIHRCAELHVNHIAGSGDPFEFGSARPLDFGHWAAHKLEQLSNYKIRHGEAVAVGIALDVIYSKCRGYLPEADCHRILQLLKRLGFELFANELLHANSDGDWLVLKGLEEFREHLGGELTITLLREIGQGFEVHDVEAAAVRRAIAELESHAS